MAAVKARRRRRRLPAAWSDHTSSHWCKSVPATAGADTGDCGGGAGVPARLKAPRGRSSDAARRASSCAADASGAGAAASVPWPSCEAASMKPSSRSGALGRLFTAWTAGSCVWRRQLLVLWPSTRPRHCARARRPHLCHVAAQLPRRLGRCGVCGCFGRAQLADTDHSAGVNLGLDDVELHRAAAHHQRRVHLVMMSRHVRRGLRVCVLPQRAVDIAAKGPGG